MKTSLAIAALGAGLFLLWAGFTGGSIPDELRAAFTGPGASRPGGGGGGGVVRAQ